MRGSWLPALLCGVLSCAGVSRPRVFGGAGAATDAASPAAPEAATCLRQPDNVPGVLADTINGVEVRDPFRWLEDRDSERVRQWVDARDSRTRQFLSSDPRRAAIVTELTTSRERPHVVGTPLSYRGRVSTRESGRTLSSGQSTNTIRPPFASVNS